MAGVGEPTYDLFFAAALNSGSFSPNGGVDFSVTYKTASGTLDLLHVVLDATGAKVTNGNPNGLKIYRLPTQTEGPTEKEDQLTSLSALQTLLLAALGSNRTLSNPLFLGFMLDGLQVPTIDLGNGAVAEIGVDLSIHDAAAVVPEPESFALVGFGLCTLFVVYWRARKVKQSHI